jgi:hypothetical protein
MKIAITGHTSGLGKGLYDHFVTDHTVYGYSKSNGYELSRFYDVVVEKSLECDVFINNAYVEHYQNAIFELLVNKWKDDSTKTIVNMNSIAKFERNTNRYALDKHTLAEKSMKASMADKIVKCRVINVTLGPIRDKWLSDVDYILSIEDCVRNISWAIMQPQHVEIAELTLWTLNRKVDDYMQRKENYLNNLKK